MTIVPMRLMSALLASLLVWQGAWPSAAVRSLAGVQQPRFGYPIGSSGSLPGDGFFIRHGYATENTWYNPQYWHTAEDWYAIAGDTAGAAVIAVADGQIVYVGANYPGRVVIIQHGPQLYSMYGHLDLALQVRNRQRVQRGDMLGVVLRRSDTTPNHLHFELRTFLTSRAVNGARPRYPFRCGVRCPPGPGYWPINAPDHPSEQGWRNPTHVINRRMFAPASAPPGHVVVATSPVSASVTLWSAPFGSAGRIAQDELALQPGERFNLLSISTGAEDTRALSALGYELWYRIMLPDRRTGWVQAAVPSAFERGGNGQPSSVYFNFIPATADTVPQPAGANASNANSNAYTACLPPA